MLRTDIKRGRYAPKPIIVNTMSEAVTRDQRAAAIQRRYLPRQITLKKPPYASLPHPVAIPGKGWTPQSGGASEVAR